ncbi:pyridoxamine 5'-phosphate oxidase [Balneolaceae bacterium YR4-1]|uniref:Pyridoxamine 5'-phosphate oxidase n=1 Tax=Halalkalibaculum roseum TaxID=2709311 RepID=A0A6M1T0L8_9BACT|nr:pyridoxamine 5'-phosphate oxidase [Halalkalibaculum roseum]NGP77044.1 pyridoxamine 5'-phosphate oxidase [Halalkalibaculum roseum]
MEIKSNESNSKIEQLRREYAREELLEENVSKDPVDQFATWFEQALQSEVVEPNAMSLATAGSDGNPSVRIVLLKGFDKDGFRFFSNYQSRKGKELDVNPNASLCFFWPELERQVRLEGSVEKISREESEEYFHKRPRLSQIGAWASNQSEEVISREELEERFQKLKKKYEDNAIPVPEYWGGYLLKPSSMEFWQGRRGRLHDRLIYVNEANEWTIKRLAP